MGSTISIPNFDLSPRIDFGFFNSWSNADYASKKNSIFLNFISSSKVGSS